MVKVYNNPPLVEALCEFRFDPGSPWDVTVFGHYYDRIHQEFPDKRQTPQVEVSLGKHPGGMVGEVKERGVRMQFSRSDGSAMVQLAPHLLVVNKLPPYESWPVFKTLILARMADYQEVVGSVPLQQVGLRYINRFDFPAESFSVGTAFESSEFLPRRLMGAPAPFFLRFEMPQGTDGRLVLTVGTIESESPDRVPVLLDLDCQTSITTQVDAAALSSHLDNAHGCIEEAFESCLTDDLRRQLQGEG